MPVIKLTGLSRPRVQGDAAEAVVRRIRIVDILGANYKDVAIYNNTGQLIVTEQGDGSSVPSIFNDILILQSKYFGIRYMNTTLSGNDQTIPVGGASDSGFVRLSDGGAARTGLRIAAGGYDGQLLVLAHVGSNTVTFHTTEATSRVAGSATFGIISPLMSVILIWDITTARWYPVRPLT